MRKDVALEPLVGHLRHPYGLKSCVADLKQVWALPVEPAETDQFQIQQQVKVLFGRALNRHYRTVSQRIRTQDCRAAGA